MTHAPLVVVALGSNQGVSRDILQTVLARLRTRGAASFRVSSLWRSSPVDCPPGSPDFLNAAACLEAAEGDTPESWLNRLQSWEREFGRQPKRVHNESRPLDLDLIVFGTEIRHSPALVLPHPRAHLRRFVLEPLAEIVPDLVPPTWPHSVRQTLAELRNSEVLERLPSDGNPSITTSPG